MINNYLKNICLIIFALFGPIYLPAGGIQRDLNEFSFSETSNEVVLTAKCSIYCMPKIDSNKIRSLKIGTSVYLLREWTNSYNDKWVRVLLAQNIFSDESNKPIKGWIRL